MEFFGLNINVRPVKYIIFMIDAEALLKSPYHPIFNLLPINQLCKMFS